MTRALPLVLLLLAACAERGSYDAWAARHIGETELQLVDRLGPPTRSHEVGGAKYLQWERRYFVPPSHYPGHLGRRFFPFHTGGYYAVCRATYRLEPPGGAPLADDALVVSAVRHEGGCRF